MKKIAAVLFLLGASLLVAHSLNKEPVQVQRILEHWGDTVGIYIRYGITSLGVVLWLFARTSE